MVFCQTLDLNLGLGVDFSFLKNNKNNTHLIFHKYAPQFSNDFYSGTECRMDSKPGCKFEFVRCLKVCETKFISEDHEGTLADPYLGGFPKKARQGPFRVQLEAFKLQPQMDV